MSSLATPPIPPHFHEHTRLSPSRSSRSHTQSQTNRRRNMPLTDFPLLVSTAGSSRKRKASPSPIPEDDPMNSSPVPSNARLPNTLAPSSRKRIRANLAGRPLAVERLLETLDTDSLRSVLRSLCSSHPDLKEEVVHLSPRPSIQSTLQVLRQYHTQLMASFPLDPNPRSDYCYDRVRPQLQELLNALTDFTPHFLPPNEMQSSTSLSYLDGVTQLIHDLPEWDNSQHNYAKANAYEEISRAWAVVIREASKRGGGIQLQYGGWQDKLRSHNELSGGKMQEAYEELMSALGWLRPEQPASGHQQPQQQSIRQQLFSGTYGQEQPAIRTGIW
jgi:protein Cut8